MDNETESNGNNSESQATPTKKAKSKSLVFTGIGCLGLIALVVIGFFIANRVFAITPLQEFQNQNIDLAKNMPEVEEVLGIPITAGKINTTSGGDSSECRVLLTGPKANGTLVIAGNLENGEWTRESIYLEHGDNGTEKLDLDPESMFKLDIDTGF